VKRIPSGISGSTGAAIAMVAYVCAATLGLPALVYPIGIVQGLLGALVVGFALARVRFGAFLLVAGLIVLMGLWIVVRYTTVTESMVRGLEIDGPPEPSDAVVVLSSGVFEDGSLDGEGVTRLLRGLELVGQGYAPKLVLTQLGEPGGAREEAVIGQIMAHLHSPASLAVVGPIVNTHDEAVLTARLARSAGWTHVMLVTAPIHTRRATETFRKAGLVVTPVSSASRPSVSEPAPRFGSRLDAFRLAVHEYVGRWVYYRRGWI
jgi:uncharacterized SAM-binding protein YcdF (DUF218 family)